MIKVKNLNKYYNKGKNNEIHVINNTNLELPTNGLISLLGQSGSGKTTLLNVIGGLDRAKGTIEYDNIAINNYNMKKVDNYRKDNIGYIFQNYNLLNDETVYDNLAIALEMIGITDKEEIDKRIEYTLKSVGMFKYRKKLAFALSGGQQQRVAIARALVKDAKIIIADEPTGNLDSENTIEVMNILKKISKNTLVLLVTHDINIAKFYSDYIIELKDGKIVKSYSNDINMTLSRNSVNHVYLKDMHLNEEETSIGNIKLYNDSEENFKIDLELIVRNGNIYINSNLPLKLVEASNLKIINDHYQDLNASSLEEISYDTSWFNHKKVPFKEKLKSFIKSLKNAFHSFKNTNKRGRILYFAFGLMGVLLGASVICTINFATPDTTPFIYAEGYHYLTSENHTFVQNPIMNIVNNYKDDKIENISLYQPNTKLNLEHTLSFHKEIKLNLDVMVTIFDETKEDNVILGRRPNDENEIVVDKMTANDIKNAYGNDAKFDEVLGEEVKLYLGKQYAKVTIVGIINGSQRTAMGTKEFYTNWCCTNNIIYFGNVRFYKNEVDQDGNPLYEITRGRDVNQYNIASPNPEVILSEDSEYADWTEIVINGAKHEIVGNYRMKDGLYKTDKEEYIANNFIRPTREYDDVCVNPDDVLILEGRMPITMDECMVSIYSGKKIGTMCDGKTIVGIYNGTTEALSARKVITRDTYILSYYDYSNICFTVKDHNLTLGENEKAYNIFEYQERTAQEDQVSNLQIFRLLSVVLIIISVIFIYLVMRSKMFSEIYNVGVYRSLGVTRTRITMKFFLDLFILTTFTTLVGYLFILLVYNYTADSINDLLGERMFKINNLYALLGMLGVYVMNLIFGIIPVLLLLRKTPSEICSKYDI